MKNVLFLLIVFLPFAATAQEEDNVIFQWAFGAMVGTGQKHFTTVTRDTVVNDGDEMKFFIMMQKLCYVYVIYQNTTGGVELLFPYSLDQFEKDWKVNKNYFIPRRGWFVLDKNKGKETYHVLAASERLKELEDVVIKYRNAPDADRLTVAGEVITSIRDTRKKFKTSSTLGERPISIGGNVRGTKTEDKTRHPDVSDFAIEIKANNFYAKTFTLDHK